MKEQLEQLLTSNATFTSAASTVDSGKMPENAKTAKTAKTAKLSQNQETIKQIFLDTVALKNEITYFHSELARSGIKLTKEQRKPFNFVLTEAIQDNFLDLIALDKILMKIEVKRITKDKGKLKKPKRKNKVKEQPLKSKRKNNRKDNGASQGKTQHASNQEATYLISDVSKIGRERLEFSQLAISKLHEQRAQSKKERYEPKLSITQQCNSSASKQAQPTNTTLDLSELKNRPQIGLGTEPNFNTPRINRSEVRLDTNTKSSKLIKERSILYAAGWSLKK